jgi:ABC-2 type transport system ATP-binding protein
VRAASGFRSVGVMITAEGLTKRYGARTAVDDISFAVRPGTVTGFLGPSGAGKSTTMRMVVGLDRPSSGRVTVNGKQYADHCAPMREVGALLDAKALHRGRTAYNHLLAMAVTHGLGAGRVREVIELTGLEFVARKRAGGFSLGIGQRLGIAAAMLGDPATLILDEPVNGLDAEGVLWLRLFVRKLATEGRTVFLSSHFMSEMALIADHLIVLRRGAIIADAPVADVIAEGVRPRVLVRSPHSSQLADLLVTPEVTVIRSPDGMLEVTGLEASGIGDLAALHGLAIHELTPQRASLEDAYMALTSDSVEYRTGVVR